MSSTPRKAAGFVLYRVTATGPEFLLLRNARHGTWGFPKGHLDDGEDELAGAMRELGEETGLTDVTIDDGFLETSAYRVREGDDEWDKVVVYRLARLESGELVTSEEHDASGWYAFEDARARLAHDDLVRTITAAHAAIARS